MIWLKRTPWSFGSRGMKCDHEQGCDAAQAVENLVVILGRGVGGQAVGAMHESIIT
jgi:hypothetical protein